ncbi:MAG: ATP-binding cassette domain-containing protein [Streptosporangiaceae bacterium]
MPEQLKPIRYSQWSRWADSYHGWRDGRSGIPKEPPSPGPVTTPHREALIRLAQDAFAREHLEYLKLVAEPHRKIMAERARLEGAQAALASAKLEFGRVPEDLTEGEARRRRLGESRHSDSVVIRRRRKEYRDLRAGARTMVARAESEVIGIEADRASALEEARQHHSAAAIRVERIHQYIHRRLAVHRRALIRFHPDGAWANLALSMVAPEIPGWVLPDAYTPRNVPPLPPPPESKVDGVQPPAPPAGETIELTNAVTWFGSPEGAEAAQRSGVGFVKLASPLAAERHFTIRKLAEDLELRTHGHKHGPYLGGNAAVLKHGDYFDFVESRYTVQDRDHLRRELLGPRSIVAYGLSATTGPKPRLTRMSFVQRENTLLAILGPSGAGKSSLCFAMLGELPLQAGRLFFAKLSMATHARQIRDRLGFVPQDTVLHLSLTVETTLRYGYSLRSSGRRRKQRDERIAKALKDTSLEKQQHQLLSTLSGGQLRRVSIALELLSDPALLMLDEPTSGLDASMDRQIMGILRAYAEQGHTVVVVTHNTEHLSMAHQIVVVVEGGTPVFSGTPAEIRDYFGFSSYADLMSMLLDQGQRHRFAEQYQAGARVGEAKSEAAGLEEPATTSGGADGRSRKAAGRPVRDTWRQFGVLVARQVRLLRTRALKDNERNGAQQARNAVIVSLPLIIATASAALAALVAGPPGLGAGANASSVGPTALALLTTLCVLSGQALTYSDVVNELDVIRREYRAGVGVLPVLTAKGLVYAVMAVAQAGLITVMFCVVPHRAPQRSVLFGPEVDLFIGLAALSIAAMALGILISALSTKLEHAVALVTATSIAQIALNGVTSDFSQLSVTSVLAATLPDRWGLAAAASSVDLRGIDHAQPSLASRDALWTHSTGQWLTDLAALIALAVIFFALAAWRLNERLRPKRTKAPGPPGG